MKATKTNLKKLVDWSSSRYNEYRKSDVIDSMHSILQSGEGAKTWSTGSYSERGHLGGWTWRVDGAAQTITRTPGLAGERESVFSFVRSQSSHD